MPRGSWGTSCIWRRRAVQPASARPVRMSTMISPPADHAPERGCHRARWRLSSDRREEHGLDGTVPKQDARWLGRVVQFDLGVSYRTGRSVTQELLERLPARAALGVAGFLTALAPDQANTVSVITDPAINEARQRVRPQRATDQGMPPRPRRAPPRRSRRSSPHATWRSLRRRGLLYGLRELGDSRAVRNDRH